MESDRGRAELWVGDVMSSPIRACAPTLALPRVAGLMAKERIHCVAVVGDDSVLGVVSDLDLIAASGRDFAEKTAAEAANEPLASIPVDAPLDLAAREMRERRVHHLVVVDGDPPRPVGVISTLDLLRHLAVAAAAPPD